MAIPNDLAQIAAVRESLERFAAEHSVPREPLVQLQVALDEILSNVIKYAWPEGGTHELLVRMSARSGVIHVEVVDDGQAFDPLAAAQPAPVLPGRKRQPGGLGLHMSRQLVDSLMYERADSRNRLLLTKRYA